MFMFFDLLFALENPRLYAIWINNEGEAMRDNLGNILYFNTGA